MWSLLRWRVCWERRTSRLRCWSNCCSKECPSSTRAASLSPIYPIVSSSVRIDPRSITPVWSTKPSASRSFPARVPSNNSSTCEFPKDFTPHPDSSIRVWHALAEPVANEVLCACMVGCGGPEVTAVRNEPFFASSVSLRASAPLQKMQRVKKQRGWCSPWRNKGVSIAPWAQALHSPEELKNNHTLTLRHNGYGVQRLKYASIWTNKGTK